MLFLGGYKAETALYSFNSDLLVTDNMCRDIF